ncbi:MAG: SRPBCC domain-containing protein [Pirellulales bacterium]|nr:SRPBCC domain-containing protein [Pirellulales bacterium]
MKPLQLTTPSETEIRLERSFDAPLSSVWQAYTESQIVQRWLTGPPGYSMPECEIDFRPGGRWRYLWLTDQGEMEAYGTFREIIERQKIVYTETFAEWPDYEALGTASFTEAEGLTTIVVNIAYGSQQARDAVIDSHVEYGMEMSYSNLDELLAEGK